MKFPTRVLVYMAVLVACSVILRRILTVPLPIGILNFGGFPVVFAGLLLGPYAGAMVGAVSDILGCFLFPRGPYLPYFTITSMLTGCLAPLVIKYLGMQKNTPFWAILLSVAVAQGVTKMLLIPVIMQHSFGIPFVYTFIKGSVMELIHIPLYAVLSRSILLTQKESYITPLRKIFLMPSKKEQTI